MENIETKNKADIVILVNGPGELSSYVKPTIAALTRISKDARIILMFTPCPYATGKETEIAKSIQGISNVLSEREFIKWALWRKPPSGIVFNKRGVVVFLGGDVLYGKMIAKKLGFPAIAYTESYAKWPKIYKKYLVPDNSIYEKFVRQGFPKEQLKIVGNLMVDSIKATHDDRKFSSKEGVRNVSFLPGSREFQVQLTFSYFKKTAVEIKKLCDTCCFSYIISPYLPEYIFDKYIKRSGFKIRDNSIVDGETRIKLIQNDQQEAIAASDLVITVPGTNTAEVAVIGTPMIVVFPEDTSQMIPLEGFLDLIGKVPVLGFVFKKIYVKIMLRLTRFFAIPNIKAGKEIVPELKGQVKAKDIAEKAVSMLKDRVLLEGISKELRSSLGKSGASEMIAREIMNEIIF